MDTVSLKEALKIIKQKFEDNNINWAIIGSANLKLQGMDKKPNDLDLVINLKDLKRTKEIFLEYRTSKIHQLEGNSKITAWKFDMKIKDFDVEILAEEEKGSYAESIKKSRIINIKFEEIIVPCFTLEAEAEAYEATNRKEKGKIIREFMKK